MSTKRKIAHISRDTSTEPSSSPLTNAYGLDDCVDQRPKLSHLNALSSSVRHTATTDTLRKRSSTLDQATKALQQATAQLRNTSTSHHVNRSVESLVDSRCIACQKNNWQCHCQKPICTGCKHNQTFCQYYLPSEKSNRCLRCQENSSLCDLGSPSCSTCTLNSQRCRYPGRFLAKWCVSCRQPGRRCDTKQPRCSECKSRNQLCRYDGVAAMPAEVEIVDLESESDAEHASEAEYEVEKILDLRSYQGETQYLVRWKDYGEEDNTWEPVGNLAGAEEAIKDFNARMGKARSPVLAPAHLTAHPPARPGASLATLAATNTTKSLHRVENRHDNSAEVIQFDAQCAVPRSGIVNDPRNQLAVHPSTFHAQPQPARTFTVEPEETISHRTANDVEHIITHRKINRGHEYLVRWKGGNATTDSWVDWKVIVDAEDARAAYKRVLAEKRLAGYAAAAESQSFTAHDVADPRKSAEIVLVLNRRWQGQRVQYLVQWNRPGYPSTWEDEETLSNARHHVENYRLSLKRLHHDDSGALLSVDPSRYPTGVDDVQTAMQEALRAINHDSRDQIASLANDNNKVKSASVRSRQAAQDHRSVSSGQAPKRGRPRKHPFQDDMPHGLKSRPAGNLVEVVDLGHAEDAATVRSRKHNGSPHHPAKYIAWPKSQPRPGQDKLPVASGMFDKHTVATHVLRSIGKHPWLPELNSRLAGLLDKDADGTRRNAQEQHSKGLWFKQMMAKREAELRQQGR